MAADLHAALIRARAHTVDAWDRYLADTRAAGSAYVVVEERAWRALEARLGEVRAELAHVAAVAAWRPAAVDVDALVSPVA